MVIAHVNANVRANLGHDSYKHDFKLPYHVAASRKAQAKINYAPLANRCYQLHPISLTDIAMSP